MSDNKGKDGEMRFIIAISSVGIRENGFEFERHSATNQPDMGVDVSIKASAESIASMCESAAGRNLPELRGALGDPKRRVKARVDVKATASRLSAIQVNKFADDVPKNPGTQVHIMAGGSGFTKLAQRAWDRLQDAHGDEGKVFIHMTNEDVARLASEHSTEMNSALSGPLGPEGDRGEET